MEQQVRLTEVEELLKLTEVEKLVGLLEVKELVELIKLVGLKKLEKKEIDLLLLDIQSKSYHMHSTLDLIW